MKFGTLLFNLFSLFLAVATAQSSGAGGMMGGECPSIDIAAIDRDALMAQLQVMVVV